MNGERPRELPPRLPVPDTMLTPTMPLAGTQISLIRL